MPGAGSGDGGRLARPDGNTDSPRRRTEDGLTAGVAIIDAVRHRGASSAELAAHLELMRRWPYVSVAREALTLSDPVPSRLAVAHAPPGRRAQLGLPMETQFELRDRPGGLGATFASAVTSSSSTAASSTGHPSAAASPPSRATGRWPKSAARTGCGVSTWACRASSGPTLAPAGADQDPAAQGVRRYRRAVRHSITDLAPYPRPAPPPAGRVRVTTPIRASDPPAGVVANHRGRLHARRRGSVERRRRGL